MPAFSECVLVSLPGAYVGFLHPAYYPKRAAADAPFLPGYPLFHSVSQDREASRSALDDERELQRQVAAERARLQHERIKEAYREMASGGMAKDMRAQDVLRAQIRNAYRMGNVNEAQRLAARLAPDDNK